MSAAPWAGYYTAVAESEREPAAVPCGDCDGGMVFDPGCGLDMVRVRCLRPCPCSGVSEWPPCGHQRTGGGR